MRDSHTATRSAGTIALVYAVVGGMWILLSDRAVEQVFNNSEAIIHASMLKGWFYVGATSLLLFLLLRHYLKKLNTAFQREVDHHTEQQHTLDLLSAIADHTEALIFAKDLQGRYLLFNPAACRYSGKHLSEVLGQVDWVIFPHEQAQTLIATGERVLAQGRVENNEEVLQTALGQRTFLATRGPLRDAEQRVYGHFGILRDITDIKQAQQTMEVSEQRLRLLIQNSPAALAMFDREMRYLVVSDRWLKNFALGDRDLIGLSHYAVFPEIGTSLKAIHQRGLAGETVAMEEDRFERADGTVQWLRWEMRPWHAADGGVGGIVIFSENITERKTAELVVQRLADDMNATLQAIPDLLFEVDDDGRYLSVKATREALLAAPPDQLLGRTVAEVLPPEAARTVMAALAGASRVGTDYGRTIMLPLPHGDCHFEISVARKPTPKGQSMRFIVLSRDITSRTRVEAELRQRNAELERFNRATVGREMQILEMKKTINALSQELGRAPLYPLAFMQGEDGSDAP